MAFGGNFAQLVDRRPNGIVLSPSQIDKYDRCKRAWAFEYIGGLRPPPHPSAELGLLVHDILEKWLKYGIPPDTTTKAGKIAAKMIVHLPLPGTGVAERQFYMLTRNGFAYTGKIDWSGIFYNWPTVVDHKTTGNLVYAKTEAGLHCDVQGLSYTIAGCYGFEVDDIQLLWNYGTTKDRDPVIHPVRTRIRLPIAEEKFERVVEPLAAEMVAARLSNMNPHLFQPNPHACDDFGGCPHRRICQLTNEERQRAMTEQQPPTLAARLATMPQANGYSQGGFMPPGVGAPQYQQQPPQYQPQPQQPQSPQYQQQPQQPQQPMQYPQQQQAPQYQQPQQQQPAAPAAFTPPPQQGMQLPPQPAGFMPPQMQPQQQAAPFNPNVAPNPPEAGTQMPQAAPTNGVAEEKKRPRGRPRKEAVDETVNVSPTIDRAQAAYLAGVCGMIGNPGWNGQLDQLIWAGDLAVQALHARFG